MGMLTVANEIYELGKHHYYQGVLLKDNPYWVCGVPRSSNYLNWRAGWLAAEHEDFLCVTK